MKIVAISDTHNRNNIVVPDGDILVHAGDFSGRKSLKDLIRLNKWFGTLPHKHKILVAGNHDWCWENDKNTAILLLTNAIYLEDSSIIIDGVKLYGTPYQPWFYDWAFNKSRKELIDIYSNIPLDTDVLITHTPPKGILDETANGMSVGSEELRTVVDIIKPPIHIFGHIHESYGHVKQGNTDFYNASVCNEDYNPINKPAEIIYNKEGE